MNKVSALLVCLLVTMNISIEILNIQNVSGAEILFIRSVFNLLLVFVVAGITKQPLLPRQPKLQVGAFICLGLSLLLIFTAYQYISAGSVSTLQRLDIPLLAVLAMHQKFSLKKLLLSVLAFLLVFSVLVTDRLQKRTRGAW